MMITPNIAEGFFSWQFTNVSDRQANETLSLKFPTADSIFRLIPDSCMSLNLSLNLRYYDLRFSLFGKDIQYMEG